jgi:CRP-like cAMP-binding protein
LAKARSKAALRSPEGEIIAKLGRLRNFRELSKDTVCALATSGVLVGLRKNALLWEVGEPAQFFSVVTSGLIEVVRFGKDGEEAILGIFGPGDVTGLSAYLRNGAYPATARACVEKSQVIKFYLPLASHQSSKANPVASELTSWLREMLLLHEKILIDKIDVMAGKTVATKVVQLMVIFATRFATGSRTHDVVIPLRITKTQISQIIGARIETTIRLMNKLEKRKLIKMSSEGIFIPSLRELEAFIDDDLPKESYA